MVKRMARWLLFSPRLPVGWEVWAIQKSLFYAVTGIVIGIFIECTFVIAEADAPELPTILLLATTLAWFMGYERYSVFSAAMIAGGLATIFAGILNAVDNPSGLAGSVVLGLWIVIRFFSVGPARKAKGGAAHH